jgi:hypothetical protein
VRRIRRGKDFGTKVEPTGVRAVFAVVKSEDLPHRARKWVSKERMDMASPYQGQESRVSRAYRA